MLLYVHIPFCRKKCRYCSFASFPWQEAEAEKNVRLILREARARSEEAAQPVDTVYIGGGTPSLLPPGLFRKLVSGLKELFPFDSVTEFTSEANPGTVTDEWLDAAAESGVNRLSFGVQSSRPELLETLGRIHTFPQAVSSFRLARKHGFGNINLDLIFGIPGQTISLWQETLEAAVALGPEHVSAYGLIPEEGTPLFRDLEQGFLSLPDPEEERAMYDLALSLLKKAGLEQYEISNFARPGCACAHNTGYWTQEPYLGLGVSAASMTVCRTGPEGMLCRRHTNPSDLGSYESDVDGAPDACAWEEIDPAACRFETMMLGLRMNRGVDESRFFALHGVTLESCWGGRLRKLEEQGLAEHTEGCWRLTRRGFDIQNSILVELMD